MGKICLYAIFIIENGKSGHFLGKYHSFHLQGLDGFRTKKPDDLASVATVLMCKKSQDMGGKYLFPRRESNPDLLGESQIS